MTSPPPPQLPTDLQPLQLIVYPSPLFAAHWALFLPSASDPKLGTRIHADGSPAIGFEVLIEEDYDLKECTQSWNVFELGTVDVGGLMGAVRSVEAPGKSLRAVGDEGGQQKGKGPRRKIELKNCQTWVLDVIRKLVQDGWLSEEGLRVVEGAPKKRV